MNKRQNGIYYTSLFNPFKYRPFLSWIDAHNLKEEPFLEPFAGKNSIVDMLQDVGLAHNYQSYDIYPQSSKVDKRDTITQYPKGYRICITNPPWLYKSSAHRRGLSFPTTHYDDLYKLCLSIILANNEYAGVLVPASFVRSELFQKRLEKVVFLNKPLFADTENPVCLALFSNGPTSDIEIYDDDVFIGTYAQFKQYLPPKSEQKESIFNDPNGTLGFIAIDNNIEPSIKFCEGKELEKYAIGHSSRSITRIGGVETTPELIKRLNGYIKELREKTNDIFLTAFKGLRKDGKYRRRMEYKLARDIVHYGI